GQAGSVPACVIPIHQGLRHLPGNGRTTEREGGMQTFEFDWSALLGFATVWRQVPRRVRLNYLAMNSYSPKTASEFDPVLPLLLTDRLLVGERDQLQVRLPAEMNTAFTALQAMLVYPIFDVPTRETLFGRRSLGNALRFCVRRLMLFPGLDAHRTPIIGLWPALTTRLQRPKRTRPGEVIPQTAVQVPFRLEDMTTILAELSAEPVRVRANEYSLFARSQEQIEKKLIQLLDWIDRLPRVLLGNRIPDALRLLNDMKLVAYKGRAGKDWRVEATPAGAKWLALAPVERLQGLIEALVHCCERASGATFTVHVPGSR
ncbi:MAG: hypothetical protein ACKV0T_23135, partial [Planctomycetales bacterium]